MDISQIKLFSTHEHPCSYLEGKLATTVFVDPTLELNAQVYSELSDFGFRRSGRHLYRPRCRQCQACIPVRIPVNDFNLSRAQKRCMKRNQDLSIHIVNNIKSDEHYELYNKYISTRHADGDMFPPSQEQYEDFLSAEWGATRYLEFRLNQQLIAVAVSDQLDRGLSAIYTFFDPEMAYRSLGVFAVLTQIERCKTLALPFLYLGYWIQDCDKMKYKTQYKPLQIFVQQTWLTLI